MVTLGVTAAEAFAFLDDHERLSRHMSKRSLMMGGGKMTTTLDETHGSEVGSIIEVKGRVFGLLLWIKEVVIERRPPSRKAWETVGEPRLLVIGKYRMGFDLVEASVTRLTVWIDYDLPSRGMGRLLGKLFSRAYARWCVERMTNDAARAFANPPSGTTLQDAVGSPTRGAVMSG